MISRNLALTHCIVQNQVLATTADGAKLASKINPKEAALATEAVLELLKEAWD